MMGYRKIAFLFLLVTTSSSRLLAQTAQELTEEVEPTAVLDHLKEVVTSGIVLTIFLLILFTWAISRAMGWIFRKLAERYNRYRLRILSIYPILNVVLWIGLTVGIISYLFDNNTIWAFLASSTLVIGFAAKDALSNILGGLWLVAERPFQIGDRISLDGHYGEVKNMNIRTTIINTLDDNVVTIPNSIVINQSIANANAGNLDCMVVIDLFLPINVDVNRARKLAFEAAVTSPYINYEKGIQILFLDHFQNHPATRLRVKAYVLDTRFEKAFEGDVTETAKRAFRSADLYHFQEAQGTDKTTLPTVSPL